MFSLMKKFYVGLKKGVGLSLHYMKLSFFMQNALGHAKSSVHFMKSHAIFRNKGLLIAVTLPSSAFSFPLKID